MKCIDGHGGVPRTLLTVITIQLPRIKGKLTVVIFYVQVNIYCSFISEHFSKYFFTGKLKLINKVVLYEPMNKTFI